MKGRSPRFQNLVQTMSKASVVLIRKNIIYTSIIKHILQQRFGEKKKRSQTSLHKKIENKICNSCFCCSLPFVCKERHSREHQLHTSPLPALEPQLSSKRDPYKALLLHTILDPPETAVPVVLKHKRPNSFTKEPCGQL